MQSLPVKELLQISSLTRLESVGCPGFVHALLNTADGVHDFVALLNKVQFKTVFEDGELNLSMDGRLMQGVPPAAAKLLSQIAHGLSGLGDALTSINVSGMPSLERLPVPELVDLPTLTSLNCQGCPRLYSPPPDVANRGGVNVMKYLRLADPKQGGRFNTIIELILIGRGESGKTSVKKSLIQGTSEKIHEDKRTVGIDMTQWDLGAEANGLVFNIKDLAGQAVYSLSNQFFLVPRAIFALVWRVLPTMSADQESFELEVADMISTWLDAIQLRVPGATVVIVATHIDCAAPSQVDLQCKWVQALVDKKLAAFEQDEVTSSVRPLSVWLRGQSCRVNCLDGTGVQELKTNLISLAHSLPWWQEVVPGIFLDFQRELVEQRVKSPWLSWQCYTKIADACHLPAQHLAIATGFLHDNATIKFFDEFPGATEPEQRSGPVRIESHHCRVRFRSDDTNQGWGWRLVAWPAHEEGSQFLSLEAAARVPGAVVLESNHPYSSDCDETHDVNIAGGGTAMWLAFDERSCTEHEYDTVEILEINEADGTELSLGCYSGEDKSNWPHMQEEFGVFVYIDPEWIIDALKGLIRHNRESLLTFFGSDATLSNSDRQIWLRRVHRLASYGILHQELVPFLWPGGMTDLSLRYWRWADSEEEGELWPRRVASSGDDYDRILSLLSGCDVLHKVGASELVAPALLSIPQHNRLDARAFAKIENGIHTEVKLREIPESLFTRLLIKVRRPYSHMDFCASSAAFYGRGLKAHLFLTHSNVNAASPSTDAESVKTSPITGSRRIVALCIFTSTKRQMDQISQHLADLRRFFPGMCSLDSQGNMSPNLCLVDQTDSPKEPIQIKFIESLHLRDKGTAPSERIKRTLLELDGARRGAADALSVATGSSGEWGQDLTDRLRVVLVCMDQKMTPAYMSGRAKEILHEGVDKMSSTEVKEAMRRVLAEARQGLEEDEATCDRAIETAVHATSTVLAQLHDKYGSGLAQDPRSKSNRSRLLEIFHELDTDGHGELSVHKFGPVARAFAGWDEDEMLEWLAGSDAAAGGSFAGQASAISETVFLSFFAMVFGDIDHLEQDAQEQLHDSLSEWQHELSRAGSSQESSGRDEDDDGDSSPSCVDDNKGTDSDGDHDSSRSEEAPADTSKNQQGADDHAESKEVPPEVLADVNTAQGVREWLRVLVQPLQQFRAAVAAGLVIIPIICPGYQITDYGCWWPAFMPEMKLHTLFFDARGMFEQDAAMKFDLQMADLTTDKQEMLKQAVADAAAVTCADVFIPKIQDTARGQTSGITVHLRVKAASSLLFGPGSLTGEGASSFEACLQQRSLGLVPEPTAIEMQPDSMFVQRRWKHTLEQQLLSQVDKFLEEWRGKAPDPSAFGSAADRIMCMACSQEGRADPHFFSRSTCEERLQEARSQVYQVNPMIMEARVKEQEIPDDVSSVLEQECGHGHRLPLEDILSSNVILEAVPCPACVQHGETPPFCFNRQVCLLYFSEDSLQGARAGSVQCPYCDRAGRASSIRILDIVTPEVFISYNWGVFDKIRSVYTTQAIVSGMRHQIEQAADVVAWFDVGGGMGAGQSVSAEMQEGVRKCTVVILFLSDAYVQSGNCLREFLHAVRHAKFLIPVLVADAGPVRGDNGPSSGWTGPGPEDRDWWRHAAACSSCKDPDTGKSFSWCALAQFAPIDLRVRACGSGDDMMAMQRVREQVVLEIVKRVQSRFHRGDRIQHHMQKEYIYWRKVALLDSFTSLGDTQKLKAEALALFNRIDSNKDFEINEAELIAAFPQVDEKLAKLLIRETDADDNGTISFDELWAVIEALHSDRLRLDAKDKGSQKCLPHTSPTQATANSGTDHDAANQAATLAAAQSRVDAERVPSTQAAEAAAHKATATVADATSTAPQTFDTGPALLEKPYAPSTSVSSCCSIS